MLSIGKSLFPQLAERSENFHSLKKLISLVESLQRSEELLPEFDISSKKLLSFPDFGIFSFAKTLELFPEESPRNILNRIYPPSLVSSGDSQSSLVNNAFHKFGFVESQKENYSFERIQSSKKGSDNIPYKTLTFKTSKEDINFTVPSGLNPSSSPSDFIYTPTLKKHLTEMLMDHIADKDLCVVKLFIKFT